jgi:hypothetical protein
MVIAIEVWHLGIEGLFWGAAKWYELSRCTASVKTNRLALLGFEYFGL